MSILESKDDMLLSLVNEIYEIYDRVQSTASLSNITTEARSAIHNVLQRDLDSKLEALKLLEMPKPNEKGDAFIEGRAGPGRSFH